MYSYRSRRNAPDGRHAPWNAYRVHVARAAKRRAAYRLAYDAVIMAEADEYAQQVIGCDAREAWSRIQRGEYHGTPFAWQFHAMLRLTGSS